MPRQLQPSLSIVFLVVAVVGYFIPWIITSAGGLQMGAYDLAEWSSLVPSVRQSAPFLWTSLALRLPLAIIGVLLSISIATTHRRWSSVVLIVTVIALLPPIEFFTIYRDDANYRQQFIIALFVLIVGGAGILRRATNKRRWIIISLSILACVASGIGISQAYRLMQNFRLPISFGVGGVITTMSLVAVATMHIIKQSRTPPTLS